MKSGFIIFVMLMLVAALTGCKHSNEPNSQVAGTFGEEDWEPMRNTTHPWSAIGQFGGCTATLIAPRYILTAAHCLFDDDGNLESSYMRFKANYNNGEYLASASMDKYWYGTKNVNTSKASDWAIVKLSSAIGNRVGTIPVKFDPHNKWEKVTHVGYPAIYKDGEVGAVHRKCTIHVHNKGLQLHDCDTWGGVPAVLF